MKIVNGPYQAEEELGHLGRKLQLKRINCCCLKAFRSEKRNEEKKRKAMKENSTTS